MIEPLISLVIHEKLSIRSCVRAYNLINRPLKLPHFTTVRNWMMLIGFWLIEKRRLQVDDWLWMIDFSASVGRDKVFVVLGIRQQELLEKEGALELADMDVVHIQPMKETTSANVIKELAFCAERFGRPKQLISDRGSDVKKASESFAEQSSQTRVGFDFKHKAACLLKERLKKDPRWGEYITRMNRCRNEVQQTEVSPLKPCRLKKKARYMNLESIGRWFKKAKAWLTADCPDQLEELCHNQGDKAREKLDWIHEYSSEMNQWGEYLTVCKNLSKEVATQHLHNELPNLLRKKIAECQLVNQSSIQFADKLIQFAAEQCQGLQAGEKYLSSTEILECLFGQGKVIQKDQSKCGMTALLLTHALQAGNSVQKFAHQALEETKIAEVREWARNKFGKTELSLRKQFFQGPKVLEA